MLAGGAMQRAAVLLTLVGAVPSTVFGHTTAVGSGGAGVQSAVPSTALGITTCCDNGKIFQAKQAGDFVCGNNEGVVNEGKLQTFPWNGGIPAWVQRDPSNSDRNGFLQFRCLNQWDQASTENGELQITDQNYDGEQGRVCQPSSTFDRFSKDPSQAQAYDALMRKVESDNNDIPQAICNVRARLHKFGGIIWAVPTTRGTIPFAYSLISDTEWLGVCIFDYDNDNSNPSCGNYGSCNEEFTELGRLYPGNLTVTPQANFKAGNATLSTQAFFVRAGSCSGPNPHLPVVTKSPSSAPSTSPSLPPSPPTPKPTPAPHEHASEPMPVWLIVIMVTVVAIIVVVAVWMVCRGRSETATYNSVAGGLNHLL